MDSCYIKILDTEIHIIWKQKAKTENVRIHDAQGVERIDDIHARKKHAKAV